MKQLLTLFAALAFTSSAALADDFNNTGAAIALEGEKMGFSLSTGSATTDFADDAQVLGAYYDTGILRFRGEYIDDGSNTDYRLSLGKRMDFGAEGSTVNFYAVPEAHFTFGDTLAKDELRLSPYVGAEMQVGKITPFIEAGYDWKSTEGEFMEFSKANSYASIGSKLPLTDTTSLVVSINQEMDSEFTKTDREVALKLVAKF